MFVTQKERPGVFIEADGSRGTPNTRIEQTVVDSRVRRRPHSSSLTPHNTYAKQADLETSFFVVSTLAVYSRFVASFSIRSPFTRISFAVSFLGLATRNNVYSYSWHDSEAAESTNAPDRFSFIPFFFLLFSPFFFACTLEFEEDEV